MGRRRRHKKEHASAPAAAVAARMEPFVCDHCGAPQPVGDRDIVTCRACGKDTALPDAYKHMRDAHRLSESDAAQLDALCKDISRPPRLWERIAVVLGYAVGGITLAVMAIGAVIGVVGGFLVADKVGGGDTIAKILVGLGVIVCGFISVPFVGEWVIAFAAAQLDSAAALDVVGGAHTQFRSDLVVAGVLYFLGVVPVAIAWRTASSISHLEELQGKLSAQPPAADGTCGCRNCGAPLDAKPGALATRCIYCSAENLLSVPNAYAARKSADAKVLDIEVQAAVKNHQETKADDRRTMWTLLAAGILLAPLVCAGGWLLHAIMGV